MQRLTLNGWSKGGVMKMLLRSIALTLYVMPFRAWQYGQKRPYEAIVYGLVVAAVAMVSKLFLAILASVVVASGVKKVMEG